jgi:hypothetical protein
LKVANNFQKTKKHLENEIKNLKEKLNDKNERNSGETYDRIKFNEGSYWMSIINITQSPELSTKWNHSRTNFKI